ncbi:MAG: hypothetical protein II954_01205, partial [Synergistaceae bacterium]|nr:hypothetical protein [Synergistaceae bacterium]
PDKEIITLDKDNLSDYITLPDYINRKHEQGIIDNTKYSNLVRLQLLIEHGGTWIDSTVFCTGRKSEGIMHLPLFVFRLGNFAENLRRFPKTVSRLNYTAVVASNWFITADAHNPILELTRDLHFEYWRTYDYCIYYGVFHMFFKMASEVFADEWSKVPVILSQLPHQMQFRMYEDYSDEKMKYFAGISDFHKMTYKIDPDRVPSASSIYQHIAES